MRTHKASNGGHIRNGRIRRDFIELLNIIANSNDPSHADLAQAERIAARHGLRFDDEGNVRRADR